MKRPFDRPYIKTDLCWSPQQSPRNSTTMFPNSQLVFLLENAKFIDFLVGHNSASLKPLPKLLAANYAIFMNQILLCLLVALATKLSQSQKGNSQFYMLIICALFRTAKNQLDYEHTAPSSGHDAECLKSVMTSHK